MSVLVLTPSPVGGVSSTPGISILLDTIFLHSIFEKTLEVTVYCYLHQFWYQQ